MNKTSLVLLLLLLFGQTAISQEPEPTERERDSIANSIAEEGIVVESSVKRRNTNPLAPSKAAFYSAILPGLGQAYNKRYWKVPIVWGALGTGIYFYNLNNTDYNNFRNAFKRRRAGFTDDEFYDINGSGIVPGSPDISDDSLQSAQETAQRNRDLALVITIGLYILNIVDANVDAHLKQFNIDDNLSMNLDLKPAINYHPVTTDPMYGLALYVNF